jgi:adenine/guanine phosphoribosyltransferase-like PRPP-binding protein
MRLSTGLTLGILKSLYPRANLAVAGVGFTVTCSNEVALKLVEDSAMTADLVVDMLGINMSLG